MNHFKRYSQFIVAAAVIAAGVSVSYAIVAHAQTTTTTVTPIDVVATSTTTSTTVSPSSLQYPIAALGNCSSVSDCRDYCNISANQTACLNFAAQHNLMTQAAIARAQKLLGLIQDGQTPGNCSTAQGCRTYCSDSAHASECLNFAEQAGFVTPAQLNIIKNSAGKGPGQCDSAASCAAYCNNPANQQVCLDFARRNGLISQVEAQNIQQSAAGLRVGLQQFPGQVVSCLKNQLGDNAVGELESGNITPDASTSAAVSQCFGAYKSQIQNRFQALVQNASSTVQACLQGIGSSTVAALTQGNFGALAGDQGEKIRECLQEARGQVEDRSGASSTEAVQSMMERAREQVQNQLENLPARVKNCVQPYIALHPTSTNIGQVISQCIQAYGSSTQSGEGEGPAGVPVTPGLIRQILPSGTSTLPQPQGGPNPLMRGGDNSGSDN